MKKTSSTSSTLDLEVLKQFRVIFKSVRKHFSLIEEQAGVSGAQLWALHAIASSPGLRVTELARAMSVHQSTASNLVEKLVELSYVRREKSLEDSRAILLFVTPQGAEQLSQAPGPVRGILPDALEKLPDEVLVELNRNLSLLLAQMSDQNLSDGSTPLSDIK